MSRSRTRKPLEIRPLFFWKWTFLTYGAIALAVVVLLLGAFLWITRSRCVLSADFPSGGTLRVYYVPCRRPPFYGFEAGGLKYRVRTGHATEKGWLTSDSSIDVIEDVDLSYEALNGETLKVTDRREGSWLIGRDGTAKRMDPGSTS